MEKRIAFTILPARKLAQGRVLLQSIETQLPGYALQAICLDMPVEQPDFPFPLMPAEELWGGAFLDRAFFYDESRFCEATTVKALAHFSQEYDQCLRLQPEVVLYEGFPRLGECRPDMVISAAAPAAFAETDPPVDTLYSGLSAALPAFHLFCFGSALRRFIRWTVKKLDYLWSIGVNGAEEANAGDRRHPEADFYSHWTDCASFFGCTRELLQLPYFAPPYPKATAAGEPVFADFTYLSDEKQAIADRYMAQNPETALQYQAYCRVLGGAERVGYRFNTFADGTELFPLLRGYYGWNYRLRTACAGNPFAHRPLFTAETVVLGEEDGVPLTAAMEAIYRVREDLRRVYPNVIGAQRMDFARWFLQSGTEEYGLGNAYSATLTATVAEAEARQDEALARSRRFSSCLCRRLGKTEPKAPAQYPDGVNLCGYIRGDLGIGEHCRSIGRMMDVAQVPLSVIELANPGLHTYTSNAWEGRISNRFVYNTNLLFTNTTELLPFLDTTAKAAFQGRYNIGYWAWELPEFPEEWTPLFAHLDEVWTNSEFAAQSIGTKSTVPVFNLPPSVEVVEMDERLTRADFGIPEGVFAFLMMFDVNSITARKNPQGGVEAFRRAFGERNDVALVVKVNLPPGAGTAEDLAFLKSIGNIGNIRLITQYLERGALNRLTALCDATLSLHRSEGFGLVPAEGMYLGKPSVLTGWSGNMEYTTHSTACPVGYRLVEIDRDYGNYKKGMTWAEPDLGEAAAAMQKLVGNRAFYEELSRGARTLIQTEFSPAALGRRAGERLLSLGLLKQFL